MGQLLAERRSQSTERIKKLQTELKNAEAFCDGKACAYITGSVARGEASSHSDLDIPSSAEAPLKNLPCRAWMKFL